VHRTEARLKYEIHINKLVVIRILSVLSVGLVMEEERKREYKLLSRFEGYKKAKTCVLSCLIQFIDYASVQSLTLYIEEINIIIVLVQGLNKTSFIPSFST